MSENALDLEWILRSIFFQIQLTPEGFQFLPVNNFSLLYHVM